MPSTNESLWRRFISADWVFKARALLVGLLLLQYVKWIKDEGEIWLTDTIHLVQLTLFIVFLTYLIPRIPKFFLGLLQDPIYRDWPDSVARVSFHPHPTCFFY